MINTIRRLISNAPLSGWFNQLKWPIELTIESDEKAQRRTNKSNKQTKAVVSRSTLVQSAHSRRLMTIALAVNNNTTVTSRQFPHGLLLPHQPDSRDTNKASHRPSSKSPFQVAQSPKPIFNMVRAKCTPSTCATRRTTTLLLLQPPAAMAAAAAGGAHTQEVKCQEPPTETRNRVSCIYL